MLKEQIYAKCYNYLNCFSWKTAGICFGVLLVIHLNIVYYANRNISIKRFLWAVIYDLWVTTVLMITILGRTKGRCVFTVDAIWQSIYVLVVRHQEGILYDLLFNIIMFIPGGFLLGQRFDINRTMTYLACSSFCVEVLQIVFRCGLFEVTDLSMNILGGLMGYVCLRLCRQVIGMYKRGIGNGKKRDHKTT